MKDIKEINIENISLKKTEEDDWWNENFPWSNSILSLRKKTFFAYALIVILFPICFPLEIIYRTPRYVSDRLFGNANNSDSDDKQTSDNKMKQISDNKIRDDQTAEKR
jgi:hypothetical protein